MSTTPPNDDDPRGYNFTPEDQDQPIEGGGGQENVVDYRGTEQSQEYSDLESMYSKSSSNTEERLARRAKMDAAPEKKGLSGCAIFFLILLAAIVGVVVFLFVGEREGFNEDGDKVPMNYVNYFKSKYAGSDRVKGFYGMEPTLLAFEVTMLRIRDIWDLTELSAKAARTPKTVSELVSEKLLPQNKSKDGWGNDFEISTGLNVRVFSAGPDERMGTSDDISMGETGAQYPAEFEGMRVNRQTPY